jgi:hypothetical protein
MLFGVCEADAYSKVAEIQLLVCISDRSVENFTKGDLCVFCVVEFGQGALSVSESRFPRSKVGRLMVLFGRVRCFPSNTDHEIYVRTRTSRCGLAPSVVAPACSLGTLENIFSLISLFWSPFSLLLASFTS